jgi:uncharacterized phage infection (PIP) family protein YhgE
MQSSKSHFLCSHALELREELRLRDQTIEQLNSTMSDKDETIATLTEALQAHANAEEAFKQSASTIQLEAQQHVRSLETQILTLKTQVQKEQMTAERNKSYREAFERMENAFDDDRARAHGHRREVTISSITRVALDEAVKTEKQLLSIRRTALDQFDVQLSQYHEEQRQQEVVRQKLTLSVQAGTDRQLASIEAQANKLSKDFALVQSRFRKNMTELSNELSLCRQEQEV